MTATERSPTIVIEPMRPDDWPAVERIYAAGIATGLATFERSTPDWAHFDAGHRPDGRFVARRVDDGTVVGWVASSPYSSRAAYAGVAWESVYVAPEAQGQGIGRRAPGAPHRRRRTRPACGPCSPASSPTTRPAWPSTSASGSG